MASSLINKAQINLIELVNIAILALPLAKENILLTATWNLIDMVYTWLIDSKPTVLTVIYNSKCAAVVSSRH